MIKRVTLSRLAQKQLRKVPRQIAAKLRIWVDAVHGEGLEAVRKIPGYHDEPLKGKRKGERSIRLSRLWRAIYIIGEDDGVEFVSVEEVTPHDY